MLTLNDPKTFIMKIESSQMNPNSIFLRCILLLFFNFIHQLIINFQKKNFDVDLIWYGCLRKCCGVIGLRKCPWFVFCCCVRFVLSLTWRFCRKPDSKTLVKKCLDGTGRGVSVSHIKHVRKEWKRVDVVDRREL